MLRCCCLGRISHLLQSSGFYSLQWQAETFIFHWFLSPLPNHPPHPPRETSEGKAVLADSADEIYSVCKWGGRCVCVLALCTQSSSTLCFYGQNVIYNGCVSERTPARFSFLITLCNERGLGKLFGGPGFSMGIRGRNHI